jgi:catechol 2,3-dioxygenase-like lactoylglutathione lyase family enzyme
MRARLLVASCVAVALLVSAPAYAQLAAPGAAGVAMGHIHLVVRDVAANQQFFTGLGGTQVQNGTLQLIQFPGVFIMLRQGEPTAGTVGSVINHFGFNVKDLKSSVAKWQAAGIKVDVTANRTDQAYLMTPDGTRIEILEDAKIAEPIRMHHIHWNVVAVPEVQAWYAKHFGAVPGKRGANEAGDLPGVNLTYGKVDTVNPGTKGRSLDHIGFEIRNLPQFIAKLEAAGVKMEGPMRKAGNNPVNIAFLTDPWGTYIELTEGLAPSAPATR